MTHTQRSFSKSATLLSFENRLSERREQWLQKRSHHQLSSSSITGHYETLAIDAVRDQVIADQLQSMIDEAREQGADVSVLRVRIDQAPQIASTFGDETFQLIQNKLQQSLNSFALESGGVEYLPDGDLVFPDLGGSVEEKARLGEKLRRHVEKNTWEVGGILFEITVSVALVHMSSINATGPLLLKRSASALSQAVEMGANRLEVYGSWFAVA